MSDFLSDVFIRDFTFPLLSGGELHIAEPIDSSDMLVLRAQIDYPSDEFVRLERYASDSLRKIWPHELSFSIDEAILQLWVALYNTLFLSHPAIEHFGITQRGLKRVQTYTLKLLTELSEPLTDYDLLARHIAIGQFPSIKRKDFDLSFWVGRRHYVGQDPPKNLMRWPRLRRVKLEEKENLWLASENLSSYQRTFITLLFSKSPLTSLLAIPRPTFFPQWQNLLSYIRRPTISRLIVHEYLGSKNKKVILSFLAKSFWSRVRSLQREKETNRMQQRILYTLIELVAYLYICDAIVGDIEPSFDDLNSFTSSALAILAVADRLGFRINEQGLQSKWLERYRHFIAKNVTADADSVRDMAHMLAFALRNEKR